MRPSAARSSEACCSQRSPLSSSCPRCSPSSGAEKIRTCEDVMKPNVERNGKRLLWFLLIPVALVAGSYFVARARQDEDQQLGATTKSLEIQTVNVIHP